MRSISIGIIVVILGLAAMGFFYKSSLDFNTAAEAATEEIAANNASITKISQQNQELESQISDNVLRQAEMEKTLAALGENIPGKMSSNTILRQVFDLCATYNVTAIPLSTNDWTETQIQKRVYSVFKMTLKLSGTQNDLIGCVGALQSQLYKTLVIENAVLSQESVQITPEVPEDSPTPTPTEILVPSIDVNIAIYTR